MTKNRTAQLLFQMMYCTLGLVAVVASTGFFDYQLLPAFYVYFTNLSNYLCLIIMGVELVQTVRRRDDGFVTAVPRLKFAGMMAILLTFLVFNLLLAGAADRDPAKNFTVASILLHVVLPILYIADWALFYEHRRVEWFQPFLATIFPMLYVIAVFLRAWALNFDPAAPLLYPYFFLNLDTLGVAGVLRWVAILMAAFLVAGYLFFGLDRLVGRRRQATA